jgi:predicted dehydrogenase
MPLTRRDFTKLGALGLATGFAPALIAQPIERQTGYAIIGLGRISEHFMPGIRATTNSKVTALVSGHRDKALRIAAEYGVPESSVYSYENFDSIASNKAVDAVYVALPNSMHAEYTLRAAKAGKHVLCEKPMATSVADCEQMIAACKSAGVKLMIAYRCHYEPTHLKAVSMIRSGALGQVEAIESSFGFPIDSGEWRLDKKLAGGGPLMDVGIYCLNATRYLTGEEPESFAAFSSVIDRDGRFAQVEENLAWTSKFPSGIVASCNTTYGALLVGYFKVHGSRGSVEVSPAFNYDGVHIHAEYGDTTLDQTKPAKDPYQFQAEAEHFSHCIQNGLEPKATGEEGIRDMKYIVQIYRAAGISL